MQQIAEKYLSLGYSVMPCTSEKRPLDDWQELQKKPLEKWSSDSKYIGCICGMVSCGLEVIDVDNGELIADIVDLMPPELQKKLIYAKTVSGGYHIFYKCDKPDGNKKIATAYKKVDGPGEYAFDWRPGKLYKAKKYIDGYFISTAAIETRGEGGYVLVDPSPGYEFLEDDLSKVNYITDGEKQQLWNFLESFGEQRPVDKDKQKIVTSTRPVEERPGDDLNMRTNTEALLALLLQHGWERSYERGTNIYVRRPGKSKGISGSVGGPKEFPYFYCFTSSTEFEPGGYTPFAVYAMLKHSGNFKAAAQHLHGIGYGKKPEPDEIEFKSVAQIMGETYPDLKWAVPGIIPEGLTILAGKPKFGKALENDTPVLTDKGWAKISDINVGDFVFSQAGNKTEVTGVFPQGKRECYKITFTDTGECIADEEHLWMTKKQSIQSFGKTITTKEMYNHLNSSKHARMYIPLCKPVELEEKALYIDPYILGVILGDGSITTSTTTISSGDKFIFDEVERRLPDECCIRRKNNQLISVVGKKWRDNTVLYELRKLKLSGLKSEFKFIPEIYKFNSVKNRVDLLRGLMDTDGTIHFNNQGKANVEFNTTSYDLADGVKFLVQSLGGKCRKIRSRYTTFNGANGEKKTGLKSYRVRFQLAINPFLLPRKADKYTPGKIKNGSRLIKSIEPVGSHKCTCISVADDSNLFLVNDFTVTHNSFLMLSLGYAISTGGVAWGYKGTTKGNVYYFALEDSYRRLQSRITHIAAEQHPDNYYMSVLSPHIGNGFIEALERINERDKGVGLIIVDTLQKIRPPSSGNRNLYNAEYEDYGRLQQLAISYGIPIVAVHHTRKGTGKEAENPVDEMSGSSGLQGVADSLIVCSRKENEGKMFVTGREVAEETYKMEFSYYDMSWKIQDPIKLDLSDDVILQHLSSSVTHVTLKVREACTLLGVSKPTAQSILDKMVASGRLSSTNGARGVKEYSLFRGFGL